MSAESANDAKLNKVAVAVDVAVVESSWLSEAGAQFDFAINWHTTTAAADAVDTVDCLIELVFVTMIGVVAVAACFGNGVISADCK